MRTTRMVALMATGVISVALAGCGSGNPSATASSGSGSGSGGSNAANQNAQAVTAPLNPKLQGPASALAGAKSGGTVYINDATTPPTMDPSGIYYTDSSAYATLLYRTLTQYRYVNGKPQLVPDLATDLGTPSADGLTWTFHLKKGLKYSDGSPVTAADVVYAVKRSFAVDSVAKNGTQYQMQFLKGGDKYKGPFDQPSANFPGVTAQGTDTVVFHLSKAWPSLPYFMSFPEVSPIPQAKDTKANFQKNPVTTGPYMVKSFTIGQKMVLVKNKYWDPNTDPVRHQYPDQIVINFSVTPKTSQQQVLANSGNGAYTVDVNPIDASLQSQVEGPSKSQFLSGPTGCVFYDEMDVRQIPFNIRKIIAIAWPYDSIRKAGGASPLSYQPATTYGPLSLPGFKAYAPVNGATGQGPGDPTKAKAELKALGKVGYKLSYYYVNNQPKAEAANQAEKAGLEAAGFTVQDIGVSSQTYETKIADPKAPVNMGQGTPGWCYDWPTGDAVYPPLFNGQGIANGLSVGQLNDPTINKEIAEYQTLPVEQAAPKWAALDQQLMKDYLPALPDNYSLANFTFGNKVHGVADALTVGMPIMTDLSVG